MPEPENNSNHIDEECAAELLANIVNGERLRLAPPTRGEIALAIVKYAIFAATFLAIIFLTGVFAEPPVAPGAKGAFDSPVRDLGYSTTLGMTVKVAMLGIMLSKLATVADAVGYIVLVVGGKRTDPRNALGNGPEVADDVVVDSKLFVTLGAKLAVVYEVFCLMGLVGTNLLFGMF